MERCHVDDYHKVQGWTCALPKKRRSVDYDDGNGCFISNPISEGMDDDVDDEDLSGILLGFVSSCFFLRPASSTRLCPILGRDKFRFD